MRHRRVLEFLGAIFMSLKFWLIMSPLALIGLVDVLTFHFCSDCRQVRLIDILPSWPAERYGFLILLIALILVLYFGCRKYADSTGVLETNLENVRGELKLSQTGELFNLIDEYDALSDTQQEFWSVLREVYSELKEPGWPGFQELLPEVNILREFPDTDHLSNSERIMWEFVCLVYISDSTGGATRGAGVNDEQYSVINKGRRELVKFWNKSGLKARALVVPTEQVVDKYHSNQMDLWRVLSFLHIRLNQCLNKNETGLDGIYHLADQGMSD